MRMLTKRLLCGFLALALLTASAAAAYYPDKEHLAVDYASMPLDGFDEAALCAALETLEDLHDSGALEGRQNEETWNQIYMLYHTIKTEINVLATQSALTDVWYSASGGCSEAAEAQSRLSEQQTRLFDRCYRALSPLVGSSYENVLDIGKEKAAQLKHYQGVTAALTALYQEEDELIQAYDQVMSGLNLEEVDGLDQLEAQERNAGEIFCQLVQVRTEIAQKAGYDSYGEYTYWNTYNRDYTLEDIQPVREAVKETIVPLSEMVLDSISGQDLRALELRGRASGEEILDTVGAFLETVDPELMEAYSFLRECHLYDIEYSADKLPTGYTIGLPAYGTAFLFNSPYGDYQDYSDTVHEFGHFNETFHSTQHALWEDFNIDVGEIHSQALELLFTGYANQVFGDLGEVYGRVILYNILSSVMEGCLYDEFQAEVYENPDMELEEINRLFKKLSEEYGYVYPEDQEEDGSWVEISHTFQSPMYYISYATSALSSLDLWLWAQADRDKAVETYMELSALSLSASYQEAVHEAGLTDIFRKGGVEDIAARLEAYLKGETVPAHGTKTTVLILGAALAAVLILAAALLSWRRRREAFEPFTYPNKRPPWEY